MNRIHALKTWPEYYKAIIDGTKTFEVRVNDRDYRVGDVLVLQEYIPGEGYTREMISKVISYILDNPQFVKEGYVVMGLHDWDGGE